MWYSFLLIYNVVAKHDSLLTAVVHLFSDFGPAEVLDLVTRPVLMYILPKITHGEATGIIIAKILADMVYTWVGLNRQRRRTLR